MNNSPKFESLPQELQTAIEKLDELELSDEAKNFLKAELYSRYSLHNKAIEQLEALVNAPSQVATDPKKKDEVRRMLLEAKSQPQSTASREVEQNNEVEQSSNVQERLRSLLGEVQALRSFDPCGLCQISGGDGRWDWNPPNWICRGC